MMREPNTDPIPAPVVLVVVDVATEEIKEK